MNLLVIDDDVELCSTLESFFRNSDACASFESDGSRALDRALSQNYDLLILDVMLSGLNGFELLRQIRQRSPLPVLMLTALGSKADRVRGFELGADDYLTKPFYCDELLARVRAILRRSARAVQPPATNVLQAGGLTLAPGTRSAFYNGRAVDLTAMECEILEQLLRSSGKVVSRDQLTLHLYNREASPFDRSVDTHVSRIRRKLGEGRHLILSVRGTGYQLCDGSAPEQA